MRSKVSSQTDVKQLAKYIAGKVQNEGTEFELGMIGAASINIALKAIAIARGYLLPMGINIAIIPYFSEVNSRDEDISQVIFKCILR